MSLFVLMINDHVHNSSKHRKTKQKNTMPCLELSSLNQMAIELMAANRSREAAPLLAQGLAKMNDSRSKFPETVCDAIMDDDDSDEDRFHAMSRTSFQGICLSSLESTDRVSPGNPFSFYPVVFSADDEALHGDGAPSSSAYFEKSLAAVMLYNLATIHHQAAMQNGRSDQLKCALTLYKLAVENMRYDLMVEEPDWDSSSSSSWSIILLLVATANMAQIHAHFYNLIPTKQCVECLATLLRCCANLNDLEDYDELLNDISFHATCGGNVLSIAPSA